MILSTESDLGRRTPAGGWNAAKAKGRLLGFKVKSAE